MVTGTIKATAAVIGGPVWKFVEFAAEQIFDTPKLKDFPQSIQDLVDESNKVKKSPVGMLFDISKKNA